MMKIGMAIAAVAVTLAAGTGEASAQSRLVLGGGTSLALSDLKDAGFNNGPSLIAGYEYVSASGFGVRVDGMYQRIQGDDIAGESNRLRVLNGTANLLYVLPTAGSFKPYLIGGVGYYGFKLEGDANPGQETTNDFGFNAGAGFEAGSRVKFFGEARFHQIQSEDDAIAGSFNLRTLPISVGVKIPLGGN